MTNNAAVGDIHDDDLFVEDGWGDDDVDLGDEEGEGEVEQQHVHPPPTTAAKAANHNVADDEAGWDDDDDLDFDDDIDDKPTNGLEQRHDGTTGVTKSQQQQQQQPKYCTTRTPPPPPQEQQQQQLYKDLEAYLMLLPHLQTSVNAIFDAEYNVSPQQALDVLQYYQERPGLLDYTLEKELPRMDYTIILRNNTNNNNTHEDHPDHDHRPQQQQQQKTVLQNKTPETSRAVADCLRRHGMNNNTSGSSSKCSSMQHVLPRAANQSLLADLLQVLTGPDRVIRPQYMATAVATSCHFVVDLGSSGGGQQHDHHQHHYDNDESLHYLQPPPSVRVTAELYLLLPTSNNNNGGRWKVADMTVVAQLILPSHSSEEQEIPPPVIDYRLASIRPILHENDNDEKIAWQENLASTVALLTELDMDHGMDHHPDMVEDTSQPSSSTLFGNNNRLHYRDAFLQQSQSFWDNSTAVAVGMKSVLQDIDAVSGLSQKWAALPQLLPSTDLLLEQEAQAAAEHHWQQQQQQQQQRPPTFHPQHHPMHRGPPPQQQQQQQRPQSILGGMLGKLAKAVALPEEDPDMYRDWQTPVTQQQQQQQRQQKQQQRPSVPPAAAAAAPSSGPQLYHRERPPPPPPLPSVPAPGRIPPPMGPSWSPMPLHDKPVQSPLPTDRRNPPPPPPPPPTTPPRAAAALAQPKLSTSPLAVRPPVQDEITEIIDGWDDDDDALESENGDNDEHVNVAVSSDLDPETMANVGPALPAAYTKTHGQQQLVDSNRHPIADKHANTPSSKVAPSPPPLQPAGPAPVHDNGGIVYEEEEDSDWVYNAEDDCLPTRKRWRNPRPGPRQLASFSF